MNVVERMLNQIKDLHNDVERIQEACTHPNKVCEGDYTDGKPIEEDIFSDPFADPEFNVFDVKESGTIIECYCPDCLKKWVEVK